MLEENSVSDTPEVVRDATENKPTDTIAYETHKKLLNQRKGDQEKLRNLEQQLNEFITAKKTSEEQMLAEQGKFKELADQRTRELEEARQENANYKSSFDKAVKLSAFRDQLGGTVDNSAYYDFVKTDEIVVDPDTGVIDLASVEAVVNQFKQSHSKLYTPRVSKSLPNDAPSTNVPSNATPTNKIDVADALKAELAKQFN